MPISLRDPVRLVFPPRTPVLPAAPLDQPPLGSTETADSAPQPFEEAHVRHQATKWFTVNATLGRGWYRGRSRAMSAARWIALESGECVEVSNEATGHTWDVSPASTEAAPILAKADPRAASPRRAAVAAR